MTQKPLERVIKKTERGLLVSWFSLSIAGLLYIPISYVDIHTKAVNPPSSSLYLLWGLPLLGFLLGSISLAVRFIFLSHRMIKARLSKKPNLRKLASDPSTGEINEMQLKELEALNPYEKKILAFPNYVFVVVLISWMLNNGIAFIGLLFSLLTKSVLNIFYFELVFLILNLFMFPRLQFFLDKAKCVIKNELKHKENLPSREISSAK